MDQKCVTGNLVGCPEIPLSPHFIIASEALLDQQGAPLLIRDVFLMLSAEGAKKESSSKEQDIANGNPELC